jgi:hypothetical protein
MTPSFAGGVKSLPVVIERHQAASETALTGFGPIDLEPPDL